MNTQPAETERKEPEKNPKTFRNRFVSFFLFGIPLICCALFLFVLLYYDSVCCREDYGFSAAVEFSHGEESDLKRKYGREFDIRYDRVLGKDFCFHVDIDTGEHDPFEVAAEIHELKKHWKTTWRPDANEVYVITFNRDAEDGGFMAVYPGDKGYSGTHKPLLFNRDTQDSVPDPTPVAVDYFDEETP